MLTLWRNFLRGDIVSFEELYNTYIDDLYRYGVSFYDDKEVVLDCIHDIFLTIFNNKNIAENVNIKYYLFSSLRRSILRKKKEKDRFSLTTSFDAWEYNHAYEINLNGDYSNEQKLEDIKTKINQLPKRQREVLYLKYYLDLSYEEIANIMEVDINSCRTLSFRAVRQLRLDLNGLKSIILFFF